MLAQGAARVGGGSLAQGAACVGGRGIDLPWGNPEVAVRVRELSTGRRWVHRPERAVARGPIVGSASRSLVAGGGLRVPRSFLGRTLVSLLVARLLPARGGGARDP
ncbi:hypothetical protein GCM10010309_51460 [Streptomyces violaceochromogenes]|nr:hypothetical protein GCM10010309_51460 [Streptomyces violaceochromogenes]